MVLVVDVGSVVVVLLLIRLAAALDFVLVSDTGVRAGFAGLARGFRFRFGRSSQKRQVDFRAGDHVDAILGVGVLAVADAFKILGNVSRGVE